MDWIGFLIIISLLVSFPMNQNAMSITFLLVPECDYSTRENNSNEYHSKEDYKDSRKRFLQNIRQKKYRLRKKSYTANLEKKIQILKNVNIELRKVKEERDHPLVHLEQSQNRLSIAKSFFEIVDDSKFQNLGIGQHLDDYIFPGCVISCPLTCFPMLDYYRALRKLTSLNLIKYQMENIQVTSMNTSNTMIKLEGYNRIHFCLLKGSHRSIVENEIALFDSNLQNELLEKADNYQLEMVTSSVMLLSGLKIVHQASQLFSPQHDTVSLQWFHMLVLLSLRLANRIS